MELVSGHADLTKEEREIVEEVFNTSDRLIHEVMVPRTEVDFLDASLSISAARKLAVEHGRGRSRAPSTAKKRADADCRCARDRQYYSVSPCQLHHRRMAWALRFLVVVMLAIVLMMVTLAEIAR